MKAKTTIGKAEKVAFPELDGLETYARIDTGAKTSAIWVEHVHETDKGLEATFFGPSHPSYTGKPVVFSSFAQTIVASSNGSSQERYKVRLLITLGGRRIRAWFTLADRSTQVYPILVGRNILQGKFIVDVSRGTKDLVDLEQQRSLQLRQKSQEA